MIVRGRAVGVKRDDNYDNAEKTVDADDADADNLRCLIIITQFTRINATETSNAGTERVALLVRRKFSPLRACV